LPRRYSIAAAAEKAGITIHQARKYLHAGLIGYVGRTPTGWYQLDEVGVRRLRITGLATDAGLLIRDVAPVFAELENSRGPNALRLKTHLEHIERHLRDRRNAIDEFSQQLDQVYRHSRRRPRKTEY
jgi:DNA-binding transcriptional MerR regulator